MNIGECVMSNQTDEQYEESESMAKQWKVRSRPQNPRVPPDGFLSAVVPAAIRSNSVVLVSDCLGAIRLGPYVLSKLQRAGVGVSAVVWELTEETQRRFVDSRAAVTGREPSYADVLPLDKFRNTPAYRRAVALPGSFLANPDTPSGFEAAVSELVRRLLSSSAGFSVWTIVAPNSGHTVGKSTFFNAVATRLPGSWVDYPVRWVEGKRDGSTKEKVGRVSVVGGRVAFYLETRRDDAEFDPPTSVSDEFVVPGVISSATSL